jgi:hypothetical protein
MAAGSVQAVKIMTSCQVGYMCPSVRGGVAIHACDVGSLLRRLRELVSCRARAINIMFKVQSQLGAYWWRPWRSRACLKPDGWRGVGGGGM